MTLALHTSTLTSLPLLARGKVRDNYAVGADRILMIASDRLSAFDVIMAEPIPGKGIILTQMALFWFDKLGHICANHLTGDAPESVVTEAEKSQVTGGRSMLVKRLKPIPVEAVVRGYLAGSGWAEYQASQSVCGVPLPAGLRPCLPVTTTTATTTAGKRAGTSDAGKTGGAINGAASKPAVKPSAAAMTGPCTSATTTITAIIAADQKGAAVHQAAPARIVQQPLNTTCGRSPAKNNGRRRTPTLLPINAATSHTQPCRLPEAMPLKYAPILQP